LSVAEETLALARRCADLTGEGAVLEKQIARARQETVAQPPRTAPIRDRSFSFGIRGRALVVGAPVAVVGSVRNAAAHIPLLGRLHRQHAILTRAEGQYWLARSPHHDELVAVNGEDVAAGRLLAHGDRITLGAKEGRGRCELWFLIPDPASTTAVLRQERRWIVTPSGDAFDHIVLFDCELTIGRAQSCHIPAPHLACEEVRFSWTEAGLAVCAAGGSVHQEAAGGEWDDAPTPLSVPCRIFVTSDEDFAEQILADYRQGGDVDDRIDLIDPMHRR
jgi:hypothetical protein